MKELFLAEDGEYSAKKGNQRAVPMVLLLGMSGAGGIWGRETDFRRGKSFFSAAGSAERGSKNSEFKNVKVYRFSPKHYLVSEC